MADSMFTRIPGRLREMRSDSKIAFRRLASWIGDCSANHQLCRPAPMNPSLPTRVLDVLASDRSVALLGTRGQRGRYMALSHSWGMSSRLMATASTLEDLKGGIAISFLPKTFQGAIHITKKLGIKYLWIDCLCIVQDDPLDWEREASAMGQVYRSSYLTLSAASSTDSNTGCFPSRTQDSYITPGTLSLGYQTTRDATGPDSCTLTFSQSSQPGKTSHAFIRGVAAWLQL
jgi:hypothetical protein